MYSYCPNPHVSLWLGCLTTTPHYWPLHYTTLWCGWTTMSNENKSCLTTLTLFLKDWFKSCVSFSVANWCSNKYERRVLPLSVLKTILVDHKVLRETFSLTFLPCRWQVSGYRERTCKKRSNPPFSFFTSGSFSLLTSPSIQNLHFSIALLLFHAVFMCVWMCFFFLFFFSWLQVKAVNVEKYIYTVYIYI